MREGGEQDNWKKEKGNTAEVKDEEKEERSTTEAEGQRNKRKEESHTTATPVVLEAEPHHAHASEFLCLSLL